MTARSAISFAFLAGVAPSCGSDATTGGDESAVTSAQGVSVVTQHNDSARTGANLREARLTRAVVPSRFGKRFSITKVDGFIYAQPLYVPRVTIPGRGVHDVLYVATEHNRVYAFDANTASSGDDPLWRNQDLGFPVPRGQIGCNDLASDVGITSTPVIDPSTNTMYVAAKHVDFGQQVYTLHALDIRSGASRGHVDIGANAGQVKFEASRQLNRPGLLLANGTVYLAFGSHCDQKPYWGWILGYDKATLAQRAVFNTAPDHTDSGEGGIWQAGAGLAADAAGSVYFAAGNGFASGSGDNAKDPPRGVDMGSSVGKLSPTLQAQSFFTPSDINVQNRIDLDLGSSGPLLVPGTNLLVQGSKEGLLYVLDKDNLGGFSFADETRPETFDRGAKQRLNSGFQDFLNRRPQRELDAINTSNIDDPRFLFHGLKAPIVLGTPTFWDGPTGKHLYVWPMNDRLRAYTLRGDVFDVNPSLVDGKNPIVPGFPGGVLSLSANGNTEGIVWAMHQASGDANPAPVAGILRAFDASNLRELWNSGTGADAVGTLAKFVPPTVANGNVYVATFDGVVQVYGLK
jgi:outer membrane protein assembly factor BamB